MMIKRMACRLAALVIFTSCLVTYAKPVQVDLATFGAIVKKKRRDFKVQRVITRMIVGQEKLDKNETFVSWFGDPWKDQRKGLTIYYFDGNGNSREVSFNEDQVQGFIKWVEAMQKIK
jgi:hypothetical protein